MSNTVRPEASDGPWLVTWMCQVIVVPAVTVGLTGVLATVMSELRTTLRLDPASALGPAEGTALAVFVRIPSG